ncbi:hypothetical protein HDU85_002321 [Gaertneriomyces sp. JEL0708]|nr:hypothetical protein HDU85_002321 [Gaertneriomyces sp. JEL0708]
MMGLGRRGTNSQNKYVGLIRAGLTGENLWKKDKTDKANTPGPKAAKAQRGEPRGTSRLPVASGKRPSIDEGSAAQSRELSLAAIVVRQWRNFVKLRKTTALADEFLKRRIGKATLRHWNVALIEKRRLWKLGVKANVHFKYVVASKAWRAWTTFVASQRAQVLLKRRADQFVRRSQIRVWLKIWRRLYSTYRSCVAAEENAELLYRKLMVKRTFGIWIREYEKRLLLSQQLRTANDVYEQLLRRRTLKTWINAHWHQVELMKLHDQVVAQSGLLLVRTFLGEWRRQLKIAQDWKAQEASAADYYDRTVIRRLLLAWQCRYHEHRVHKGIELRSNAFRRRRLLKRYFSAWNQCTSQATTERKKLEVSDYFHRNILKRQVLTSLNTLRTMNDIAVRYRVKKAMSAAWQSWYAALERRRDFREQEELQPAVALHDLKIKQHVMRVWRARIVAQRAKQELVRMADKFRRRYILRRAIKYFRHFKVLTMLRKNQDELATLALQARLLRGCWHSWHEALQQRRLCQQRQTEADIFQEAFAARRMLSAFRISYRRRVTARRKQALAEQHWNQLVAMRAIRAWWTYVDASSRRMSQWRAAVRMQTRRRIRYCWEIWRQRINDVHDERVKWRLAVAHCDRLCKTGAFVAWAAFVKANSAFRGAVRDFKRRRKQECLTAYLTMWRQKLMATRQINVMADEAGKQWENRILQGILALWRNYADLRIEQRTLQESILEKATARLSQLKVAAMMDHWLLRAHSKRHLRACDEQAVSYYQQNLTCKAFHFWRVLSLHRVWEKRATAAAVQCFERNLVAGYFRRWYGQRPDWAAIYDARTRQPLVYRSKHLMREILQHWQAHVGRKKAMRNRIQDAMGWRRDHLLRKAAAQWLRIADDLHTQQVKTRVSDGAALGNTGEYEKARRCALHWRAKVLEARARRGTSLRSSDPSVLLMQMSTKAVLERIDLQLKPVSRLESQLPLQSAPELHQEATNAENAPAVHRMARRRPPPRVPDFIANVISGGDTAELFSFPLRSAGAPTTSTPVRNDDGVLSTSSSRGNPPDTFVHTETNELSAIATSTVNLEARDGVKSTSELENSDRNDTAHAPPLEALRSPSEITLMETELRMYRELRENHKKLVVELQTLEEELATRLRERGPSQASITEQARRIDALRAKIRELEESEPHHKVAMAHKIETLLRESCSNEAVK